MTSIPPRAGGTTYGSASTARSAVTTEADLTLPTSATGSRRRIVELDALRGFALCGILLVNLPWSITATRMPSGPPSGGMYFGAELLEYTVHNRFFPIFSFLFGVSFALFLDTAAARTRHPRLVLLRRLVVLGALGILHQQLHPGEALASYALFGVLILLPASWLPRWIILPAAVLTLGAGILLDGGFLLIPGLFLLGLAAARYSVIDSLARRGKQLAVVFSVAAVGLIPATVWEAATSTASYGERVAAIAGLIGAVAYSTGLLLVLGTRCRVVLEPILVPLGRMALTNYVSATLIAVAAEPLLRLHGSAHYGPMIAFAALILAVQALFSRYWLTRHRYGPLEFVWRCLTWWTWTSNRRAIA